MNNLSVSPLIFILMTKSNSKFCYKENEKLMNLDVTYYSNFNPYFPVHHIADRIYFLFHKSNAPMHQSSFLGFSFLPNFAVKLGCRDSLYISTTKFR